MTIKRILITITFFFAVFLNVSTLKLNASEEAKSYFVDGVNMTRWADTAMVYIGIDNTGQNQWGHNIVVNAEGQVTSIIQAGNGLGINLPVPEGGMVVSATGNRVQWLKDNVEVGDYALFDSISSRVLFSKTNDFSPFFSGKNISINAVNGTRNADTVVIYNISGSRTGTNAYGYEIMVNKNGYVEAVGGNNNLVPQGGYVISAIGKSNIDFLKMYGVIGAKATVTSFTKLTLVYDEESLQKSFEIKLNLLSDKLNTALKNFWILPYAELEAEIQEYRDIQIPSNMGILDRNKLLEEIDTINYKIAEEVPVETRGIWHETKETTVEQVKKVVADIKEAGLNQLNLGVSNGYRTIFPVPSNFPFKQNPLLYGADLLRAYVDETKAAGIELVLSLPIYYNPAGDETTRPQWLSKANQSPSEETAFFSPANDEFKEYILSYIKYIFENYEIDGFQLDYIRYPQSYGGLDYGYDDITKQKFAEKYNVSQSVVDEIGVQQTRHPMYNDWVEFKAGLVTDLVREIRKLVDEIRPDMFLSAAVAAEVRELSSYHQDTVRWANEGLLDVIYPMSYGEDLLSQKIPEFKAFTGTDKYLVMGSGAYLNLTFPEIYRQTIDSRYEVDGVAYFEYYSYFSHGYSEFFKEYLFNTPAISPTYNSTAAAKAQIDYMIRRINEVVLPNFAITQDNATQLIAKLEELKSNLTVEEVNKVIALLGSLVDFPDANKALRDDLAKVLKLVSLSKDDAKIEYGNIPGETIDQPKDNNTSSKVVIIIASSVVAAGAIGTGLFFLLKKKKA